MEVLKLIKLYDDINRELVYEGNVIISDNMIEGIIEDSRDLYIWGRYDNEILNLILLTPNNYPYTSIAYNAYRIEDKDIYNRDEDIYDAFSYDVNGVNKGQYLLYITSKNIDKEIEKLEIEELKFKIGHYKKTFPQRQQVALEYPGDLVSQEQYEKKLRIENKINYYL